MASKEKFVEPMKKSYSVKEHPDDAVGDDAG